MHTVVDPEFTEIFERVTHWVSFGRVRSQKEVDDRLKRVLRAMRKAYMNAKRPSTVRRWWSRHNQLRTLQRHDFAERLWREGVESPESIYGLTLKHGYKRAREIREGRCARALVSAHGFVHVCSRLYNSRLCLIFYILRESLRNRIPPKNLTS